MVNSLKNTIYVAVGEYNELVNITSTIPITIKGGFNSSSWTRGNDDKSIITGGNATADKTGRITTVANSKVTLENLDIKGAIIYYYGNYYAYGIVNSGDLTIKNCDIIGVESGSNYCAYGIYNNDNASQKLTIQSGKVTGISGSASVSSVYGIYSSSAATITISGGVITGAADSATVNYSAYGIYDSSNSNTKISISGGTITGAADGSNIKSSVYGVYSYGITITGGEVIGAAGGASVGDSAYGVYGQGTTAISNGTIKGTAGATVTNNSYGFCDSGTSTISGGLIIAAAGTASVSKTSYGVYGGTTTITGGTIIGASATAKSKSTSFIYGISGDSNTTISNCIIYGSESVDISGTFRM